MLKWKFSDAIFHAKRENIEMSAISLQGIHGFRFYTLSLLDYPLAKLDEAVNGRAKPVYFTVDCFGWFCYHY